MVLSTTSLVLGAVGLLVVVLMLYLLARCLTQGKTCPTRCRIDDKTVLITDADTTVGIGETNYTNATSLNRYPSSCCTSNTEPDATINGSEQPFCKYCKVGLKEERLNTATHSGRLCTFA